MYIVAAEPVPLRSEIRVDAGPAGRLLASVAEARDAAILLSGERPYREFPLSWYVEAVSSLGLELVDVAAFPAIRTKKWALKQLEVARQHLMTGGGGGGGEGLDTATVSAMRRRVGAIEEEVRATIDLDGGTCFGMDFVVSARRPPPR